MNYGDARKYMKVKRQYTGATAATYVARTYIDSMRYGVYRVFWYGWDINVLGTDMTSRARQPDRPEGKAFLEIQDWMVGQDLAAAARSSRRSPRAPCARGPARSRPSGTHPRRKTFTVPAGATASQYLDGTSGGGAGLARSSRPAEPGADRRSLTRPTIGLRTGAPALVRRTLARASAAEVGAYPAGAQP